MKNHKIKIYPVGNGDMSLITLKDDTTILIDCNIRESSKDEKDHSQYDVKKDLLKSIQKRDGKPYVDVFNLSHPDEDHCRGYRNNFYTGNPDDYKDENIENDEVIIDELWVTRMLFTKEQCKDAEGIRHEANRRKRLYDEGNSDKDEPGNRLVIIGYDGEEKLENVPHYIPGEEIEHFNGRIQDEFSVFIHAPFKADLIQAQSDKNRNSTSIIFQARFKDDPNAENYACLALFGGDADHYRWEKVLEKSKKNDNEEALEWDLLLAAHHCSWSFFNDVPYTDNEENQHPKDYILELLDYKRDGAKVISSSVMIKDEKPNPPHYPAKREYIKKVGTDNFLNTANHPSENALKPIEFEIGSSGLKKETNNTSQNTEGKKAALFGIAQKADKPWIGFE